MRPAWRRACCSAAAPGPHRRRHLDLGPRARNLLAAVDLAVEIVVVEDRDQDAVLVLLPQIGLAVVVAVAPHAGELPGGVVDLLDVELAVEVGVALDLRDGAGLGVVDRGHVPLAVVVEVGLLEQDVALAVVGDDPVLAAVVVEVDLLAREVLDLGPALVLGLVQPPDIGLAIVVEVVRDDVLAVGIAQRRIDLGHAGLDALVLGSGVLLLAATRASDRHRQDGQTDDFQEFRHVGESLVLDLSRGNRPAVSRRTAPG
ncbi:MAG: hypothetical protein E6J90_36885 [Deltaproteobacteria bacterium]|nr:MAG: hypothetical protein E6J90_36885 [Deltaproteobacteria bacterium]